MSSNKTASDISILRCLIDGDSYAVRVADVRQIQSRELLQLSPSERGPAGWLLGDDFEIPAFNLSRLLNNSSRDDGVGTVILVLRASPRDYALLVDRVTGRDLLSFSQCLSVPSVARGPRSLFGQVASIDDELSLLLDPSRLHEDASTTVGDPEEPSGPSPTSEKVPLATSDRATRQLLTIPIAGLAKESALVLSIRQIVEILRPGPITRVPDSPPWVLGLLSWRKRAVPLVDLQKLLGMGSTLDFERLVVARSASELIAFPVAAGVRLRSLPFLHTETEWEGISGGSFIRASFDTPHGVLGFLDLEGILSSGRNVDRNTVHAE